MFWHSCPLQASCKGWSAGCNDLPWDLCDSILSVCCSAEVPVEGSAGQDEGCEACRQHIEQAVHSAVEGQSQGQNPDASHCATQLHIRGLGIVSKTSTARLLKLKCQPLHGTCYHQSSAVEGLAAGVSCLQTAAPTSFTSDDNHIVSHRWLREGMTQTRAKLQSQIGVSI